MKNRILKSVMPLAMIAIAAFGAVAFETAPAEEEAEIWGLYPHNCEPSTVRCETIDTGMLCTLNNTALVDFNESETDCDVELYKIIQ